MKINGKNHVFECLPPYGNNRKLKPEDQIVIGLKVVTMPEQDQYQRECLAIRADYAVDKAQELVEAKLKEVIKSKFVFVRGLEIEGVPGELDFDTFYSEAPPEIVAWVIGSCMSSQRLSESERKNFLPVSASA